MPTHFIETIVALVVGLPVAGICTIWTLTLVKNWCLKSMELKIQEKRIQMEEKLRTDQMNAQILRMDDFGLSATDIRSLVEEVRQMRQEIAELKQNIRL